MGRITGKTLEKKRGFFYRFWFEDEVIRGIGYGTRIQIVKDIGRWWLGMFPLFLIIVLLNIAICGIFALAIISLGK